MIDPRDAESGPTRVAIGLIGRSGRYLVRLRPDRPGSPMPGVWEFPGGKCDPGESPEAAVVRECLEETGLAVRVVALRRVADHRYAHGHVSLSYFDCEPVEVDAEPSPSSEFLWIAGSELPGLTFPDANGPILEELASP